MFQMLGWFPGVLAFTITLPTNEVFESATKDFRVSYMVDFVLLFAFDCDGFWWRWLEAIDFVTPVTTKAIHMKNVVDFQRRGQLETIVDVTDDFSDLERSKLLWSQPCRLLMYLNLLSLK